MCDLVFSALFAIADYVADKQVSINSRAHVARGMWGM